MLFRSQQLLLKADGKGRVAALEVMIATPAIRSLIREDKIHQIDTAIQTGSKYKMQTMDSALTTLYHKGLISKETALTQAINREEMKKYIV